MYLSTVSGGVFLDIRESWLVVLFKFSLSFLIFCLLVPSVSKNEVLKSLTLSVDLFLSPSVVVVLLHVLLSSVTVCVNV